MFCSQWYEDHLHQLGDVHHIGRRYGQALPIFKRFHLFAAATTQLSLF